ncbi:MAG: SsrA-binding protein SmpB [Myxococcales bacterium]|nr:SsrA-binding protein SmpB [Myxococcales bacterium]
MSRDATHLRVLIDNRRVRHDYRLLESFEAGISLLGSEVKSLRLGQGNLSEAYVRIGRDGAWLVGCNIPAYTEANRENHEPTRQRRLLLHRHEILKLDRSVRQKGMTVVPVKLYLKGARIKLEVALAKGKQHQDRRQDLKERDARREMQRARRG